MLDELLDTIRDFIGAPGQGACSWSSRTRPSASQIVELDRRRRVPDHHGGRAAARPCELLDAEAASTAWCSIPALPDMSTPRLRRARSSANQADADLAGDRLRRRAASRTTPIVPKTPRRTSVALRQVRSPERLLDQTAFFLHRPGGEAARAEAADARAAATRPTRCWPARKC